MNWQRTQERMAYDGGLDQYALLHHLAWAKKKKKKKKNEMKLSYFLFTSY